MILSNDFCCTVKRFSSNTIVKPHDSWVISMVKPNNSLLTCSKVKWFTSKAISCNLMICYWFCGKPKWFSSNSIVKPTDSIGISVVNPNDSLAIHCKAAWFTSDSTVNPNDLQCSGWMIH